MKLGDLSTKRPILGNGWVIRLDGPAAQIRAELRQDGRLNAWLEMETRSVTREEYQKARPFVELPNSLQDFFEEQTS